MRRKLLVIVIVLLLLAGAVVALGWYYLFREVPVHFASEEEHFKYASMGTENTEGLPYWIWLILPRVFADKLPGPGGYASLGMTWEEGQEMPIGFPKKVIGFERVGLNCAACHTTTYRTDPKKRPVIVPTGPSNKFDIQAYLRFLYGCASDPRFNADYLLEELRSMQAWLRLDRLEVKTRGDLTAPLRRASR